MNAVLRSYMEAMDRGQGQGRARGRLHPYEPGGPREVNREIHAALLRASIDVKSDHNPHIFHQKLVVRDGEAVLTGSTNFTTTGVTRNLNHVVIVRDRQTARAYSQESGEIQQGRFGKLSVDRDTKPDTAMVSGVPVKVLFAPDHAPEMEIMKQMLKARRKIEFAIFTFAESSGIDDTMLAVRQAGVEVRGVLDGQQANQKWAAVHGLVGKPGIRLRQVPSSDTVGKLHHKLMIVDDQVIVAGSFNYTGPANKLNDENIIVIGDLGSESKQSKERQRRLASYAASEVERMFEKLGESMPRVA